MKRKALIIDLDGTLADIRVRLKHLQGKKKDWKSFNKTLETDQIHGWCRELINRFASDHDIIIVSGRTDELKQETISWLEKYNVTYHHLFMRRAHDYRPDNEMKLEIYEQHIKNRFNVVFVIDDRQKVVDMWRGEGLVVLQCAPGNF